MDQSPMGKGSNKFEQYSHSHSSYVIILFSYSGSQTTWIILRSNSPEKKHISFSALQKALSKYFRALPDSRQHTKVNYELHDAMMSGFACMYFQDPSLLQFQQRLQDKRQSNNLRTLFTVQSVPKDSQMRTLIDGVEKECLRPIFNNYFSRLQRGKYLEEYQLFPGQYLIPLDGVQYSSSKQVHCEKCIRKNHRDGSISYSHSALQAGVMHPDKRQVLPLMAEEISNSDGTTKQDCEINAAKRLLPKLRQDHRQLQMIICGDSLYSKQPFIEQLSQLNMHYILVAKPNDHTYMNDWLETYPALHTHEHKDKKGRRQVYHWMNDVPLNGDKKAIHINYFHFQLIDVDKDGQEKIVYQNSWVTDLEITLNNIVTLVKGGRCRWKVENECFNTLKNQGYFLEHNYGHGKNNLCFNFYLLTLLAFFFHQIFELTCATYQDCRQKFGSKRHLWETLRAYIKIIIFQSWQHLMDFALEPTKYLPENTAQPP